MKDIDFVFASAYMRTLEKKMLGKADFETLLNAASLEEASRYLASKGYGGDGRAGRDLDWETLVKEELAYIWAEIKNTCPEDAPLDVFLYQNDFHNLKTILKASFSGIDYRPSVLEPYTIEPDVIARAVAAGRPESLPDILKAPAIEAYQILTRDKDGQLAEIALDKALFALMRTVAEQTENLFLSGWVDLHTAIVNMKIALRGAASGKDGAFLQRAMMDCGRINAGRLADAAARNIPAVLQVFSQSSFEGAAVAARTSFAAFELWCDNALIAYLQSARYITFGFEPIFAFLVGKQYELRSVRTILSGLRGGVPTGVLRERLCELYA